MTLFHNHQIEQKIEDMFASRKRVTDVTKPVPGQQMQNAMMNQGIPGQGSGILGPIPAAGLLGAAPGSAPKLELARRLAAKINIQKNLGPDAQVRDIS